MTHRRQSRLTKAQLRVLRQEARRPLKYRFRHDGEILRKLQRRGYAYSCVQPDGQFWRIEWMLNMEKWTW